MLYMYAMLDVVEKIQLIDRFNEAVVWKLNLMLYSVRYHMQKG